MKSMSFRPTVFSYNDIVLLIQPNPTQPIDGPNPCPSLMSPLNISAKADRLLACSVPANFHYVNAPLKSGKGNGGILCSCDFFLRKNHVVYVNVNVNIRPRFI